MVRPNVPLSKNRKFKRPMRFREIFAEIEQGRIEPVISRDGIDSIILTNTIAQRQSKLTYALSAGKILRGL